jgi:large conductance mechanosensitive channel
MKKFMNEFKKFALKGNVMDLAVGVIIGAAFQNIVTALTGDFISPLIAAITGKTDENGAVVIGGQFTINGAVFNYGDFISAVINFIIMAFILFLLMRGINRLMTVGKKKDDGTAATKKCPYCITDIDIAAKRCPNCTSILDEELQKELNEAAK